jgi:hypothetical protein
MRFATASGLLQALLTDKLKQTDLRVPMPDSGDFVEFVRWLLIDTWNVGGPAYIKTLTDVFLANKNAG